MQELIWKLAAIGINYQTVTQAAYDQCAALEGLLQNMPEAHIILCRLAVTESCLTEGLPLTGRLCLSGCLCS